MLFVLIKAIALPSQIKINNNKQKTVSFKLVIFLCLWPWRSHELGVLKQKPRSPHCKYLEQKIAKAIQRSNAAGIIGVAPQVTRDGLFN